MTPKQQNTSIKVTMQQVCRKLNIEQSKISQSSAAKCLRYGELTANDGKSCRYIGNAELR